MKKGQTESYSFLIGIILTVIMLSVIGFAIYGWVLKESAEDKFLSDLVKAIDKIKAGENTSLIGSMGEDYMLIGFDKGQNVEFGSRLGEIWCSGLHLTTPIKKPRNCGSNACLCICPVPLGSFSYNALNVCKDTKCRVLDAKSEVTFKGGKECRFGPIFTEAFFGTAGASTEISVHQVFIQREGNVVGLCRKKPCVLKTMVEARETFDDIVKKFKRCKASPKSDCLCDEIDFTKITKKYFDEYYMYLKSGKETNISLYHFADSYWQTDLEVIKNSPFCFYKFNSDNTSNAYKGTNAEFSTKTLNSDYSIYGKAQLYKLGPKNNMGGEMPCLVLKEKDTFNAIRRNKKSCFDNINEGDTAPLISP